MCVSILSTCLKHKYYIFREECKAQTSGFPGAVYKGFPSRDEAEQFASSSRGYGSAARDRYTGDFSLGRR